MKRTKRRNELMRHAHAMCVSGTIDDEYKEIQERKKERKRAIERAKNAAIDRELEAAEYVILFKFDPLFPQCVAVHAPLECYQVKTVNIYVSLHILVVCA